MILRPDDITTRVQVLTQQIVDEVGISSDLARALLIRNDWSKLKAINEVLTGAFISNVLDKEGSEEQPFEGYVCSSCYSEYFEDWEVVFMTDCKHMLCYECFKEYVNTKLQGGVECLKARCPV